jgi:hypothetical protein
MLFLLRHWKLLTTMAIVAVVALALSIGALKLYNSGVAAERQAHQIETLQADLNAERAYRVKVDQALEDDQKRASTELMKIGKLTDRITALNAYAQALKDGASRCLDVPDVDRLRDLWDDPPPVRSTPAPG